MGDSIPSKPMGNVRETTVDGNGPGNPKVIHGLMGVTFQATGLTFQTEDARPTTKVWWGGGGIRFSVPNIFGEDPTREDEKCRDFL